MDNKSWQEEYAKLTRPFYEEWWFWPILILSLIALLLCGKAYQIYAADTAATEQERNAAYHSTVEESSVDISEISSSEETSEESQSEESSESKDTAVAEESSSEEISEVITPPPKTPQKNPAPKNSSSEISSEIIDIPEDTSEESSSEEEISASSEEIPEGSSSEDTSAPVSGFCKDNCGEKYVVNINTGKFHTRGCRHVKEIHSENKRFTESRNYLIDRNYSPCKICKP